MNKTVLAIAAVIVILVVAMAAMKVGVFKDKTPEQAPATSEAQPLQDDSVSSIESELNSIDVGSDLDADFAAPDKDIQSL